MKATNPIIKTLKTLRLYKPAKQSFRVISKVINRQRRFRFYPQLIRKGNLCFDIGANIGNRTEVFTKIGARVVAVEPQENCIADLIKKFGKNPNVTLINKAAGAKIGEGEIHICATKSGLSTLSEEWLRVTKENKRFEDHVDWSAVERVQITTLDELIGTYGRPDFCKIDVEGYELEVLKGLTQKIPLISFEYTPEFMSEAVKCLEYLSQFGDFHCNYSKGESMKWGLKNWVTLNEFRDTFRVLENEEWFGDIYVKFDA